MAGELEVTLRSHDPQEHILTYSGLEGMIPVPRSYSGQTIGVFTSGGDSQG